MNEDEILLRELAKAAAKIYADMGSEYPLSHAFTRLDIPTLMPSERVRVVFMREHAEPRPVVPVVEMAVTV